MGCGTELFVSRWYPPYPLSASQLFYFTLIALLKDRLMIVVIAALILSMPYEIGYGIERLTEKFLMMVPEENEGTLGRSLAGVADLVKKITGQAEEMVIDG